MIYITGDTHCPIDIYKLSTKRFPAQKNLSKKDFLIICGDFGAIWDNSNQEKYWLKWLENKNFTTLFVAGNHENFVLLDSFPVEKWCGGYIHKINSSVFHLMNGQIFDLDGYKVFTMGGASSHDKEHRIPYKSWWPEELPNAKDFDFAIDNLQKHNDKVDFIISHCASNSIMKKIHAWYEKDVLTNFFENYVSQQVEYNHWFFGHYHVDKNFDDKHICLYDAIIKYEGEKS